MLNQKILYDENELTVTPSKSCSLCYFAIQQEFLLLFKTELHVSIIS